MRQTLNDRVADELRVAAARRKVTGAALARQLEQPPMWVHRRLSGQAAISVEDLVLIAEALNVYPLDVLAQALSAEAQPAGT